MQRMKSKERQLAAGEPTPEMAGAAAAPADAGKPDVDEAAAADPVAALQQEVAALKDQILRVRADARNLQQRTLREKQESVRFAEADLVRDLLVLLDDLERTQESARQTRDVDALLAGVRLVYDNFLKALKERHVQRIGAVGETFNPDYHQAVLRQPSADQPANAVLTVVAPGYQMHERVLRPARVVISAGPPETPANGAAEAGE
jgi:molecular chaperone GrpE